MGDHWGKERPIRCEMCDKPFGSRKRYFHDCRTTHGPWALLCANCWLCHGTGLGTGKGQKYNWKTLKRIKRGEEELAPVLSLVELRVLAIEDDRYFTLVEIASSNLGGPSTGFEDCFDWLITTAAETTETGVVEEVNACVDLLDRH